MKCPVCKDVTLLMSEKQGVEIDYCPECRGIWLDRGELEKLLEREQSYNHQHYEEHKHHDYEKEYHDHKHHDYDKKHYEDYHKHHKKKKKEGFMGEIFDMFGD